jgi:hypothetical protein
MRNLIDLTKKKFGNPFGHLTVLRRVPNRNGQTMWECRCACGKTKVVQGCHLRNGHIKSCGCLQYQCGETHKSWKGHKEISMKFFNSIVSNARVRKIPFGVTIQQVWNLFLTQNRRCTLSGLPLVFGANHGRQKGTASLDRIDSGGGYTLDNVQWVHTSINNMKWDMPQSEFLSLCQSVCQHQSAK